MEFLEEFKCKCGRIHKCEIKTVIIEEKAIEKSINMLKKHNKILYVADENTYLAYKNKLDEIWKLNSIKCIFNTTEILIPNEESIKKVENYLNNDIDLIVGIGSGVINDLCKFISFKNKLPYYIIASAPSMDGYASSGAALIINNMKVTYSTHVPEAIIADIDVLKNAPLDMIKSGVGDIIGKYSALNDWKLSNLINNEYICENVYNIIEEYIIKIVRMLDNIIKRDAQCIKFLMESLIHVGIAMSYVGNSRPASGSEHHIAHYFEITGILNNEKYLLHGLDVLYSTYLTCKIRENIIQHNHSNYYFNKDIWKNEINSIYGKISNDIIKLQEKTGFINKDFNSIYNEKWNEIKCIISKAPTSSEIEKIIKKMELSIEYFENYYGKEKIENGIKYAKYLKDRYTVLWIL